MNADHSKKIAEAMQNKRDELRRQMVPREIFHIVTKSGKIVGPSELTREDIDLAVKHANERPEAHIYGPYQVARYRLVEEK